MSALSRAQTRKSQSCYKRFEKTNDAIYVDAADYMDRTALAITAVDQHGHLILQALITQADIRQ